MELAVDEFILDWHTSSNDAERECAESIIRLVKRKCHRMVFDRDHLDRFRQKLNRIKRERGGDTYITLVLAKRLQVILSDSKKARVSSGRSVPELEMIKDPSDRAIVRSALSISDSAKLLVTTDSDLLGKYGSLFKYGIEVITPEQAENRIDPR